MYVTIQTSNIMLLGKAVEIKKEKNLHDFMH